MASCYFSRNVLHHSKGMNKAFNAQVLHTTLRTVTVAAAAEGHQDPELVNAKPFEDIPAVKPILPIIGSAWAYFPIIGKYSLEKLHKADIEKQNIYGDLVREKFGHISLVSSFSPNAMEIFFRHEGKFPSRGEFTSLKHYRESRKSWYKTTGVMVLQGQEWYDLRTKTQKHLMKPRAIQAYLEPMQDVARDFIALIRHKRDTNMEVPGFLEDLYKWALESVAFVGLDTRLDCLNPKLPADSDGQKMIASVQNQFYCMNKLESFTGNIQFWKYLPSPMWKKFEKSADIFTEIAFKYIHQALEELKKRSDEDTDLTLLQTMLLEKGLETSGAMVMVADMLMAGIDTTSHSVGYLLYQLAKNPEHQKILHKEINNLLPGKNDRITPEIFNKLHYLKACLKESIRLHPITRGNARSLDHDVVIDGYRVPAGTVIFCLLQTIFRDEKYFKNADKFVPERWLEKDQKVSNPFAFTPFGIGTRSCIGRRLAELEITSLATEIIRNFSVEYHHEDIDMCTRLINTPDRPLRFNFIDR